MAAPETSPETPYDPARDYDVRLTRVVVLGAVKLLPRDRHTISGALLNDPDHIPAGAVDEAILIEPRAPRADAAEA